MEYGAGGVSDGSISAVGSYSGSGAAGSGYGGLFSAAGTAISGIGTAVSDFGKAGADQSTAGLYGQEAALAGQDIQLSVESGRLQQLQEQRNLNLVQGKAQADIGYNGFAASGSGLDIMKSSYQQGALMKGITSIQSAIQAQGFQEQQTTAEAEQSQALAAASAAKSSGFASILGTVVQVAGMVAMLA